IIWAAAALLIVLLCSRFIASTIIDYSWWSEAGQINTWINLWLYGTGPIVLAILIFFLAFWIAFTLGFRRESDVRVFGVLSRRLVSRIALAGFALLAIVAANATVDSWTAVKFFGGL